MRPAPSTRTTSSRTTLSSIHGEGLLQKGLIVAPNCASCHTAHSTSCPTPIPPRRSRAATSRDLHQVPRRDRGRAPQGDQGGALGEAGPRPARVHRLPSAAQDPQGLLRPGHGGRGLPALPPGPNASRRQATGGRSSWMDEEHQASRHAKVSCSQCHAGVNVSHAGPARRSRRRWTAAPATPRSAQEYRAQPPREAHARRRPERADCKECHGTHGVLGRLQSSSPTFATNVPNLCARCHREGEKAAVRYTGPQHGHRRRLHREHPRQGAPEERSDGDRHLHELPHGARHPAPDRSRVERQPRQRSRAPAAGATTASRSSSRQSIHTSCNGQDDKELPVCFDCHNAHTIRRADAEGFRLDIMQKCGRCHEEIAKTYFDTYHGKVSPARLRQDRQVLRLSRRARHPARQRPAVAPLAGRTSSRRARSAIPAPRAASPGTSPTRPTTTRRSTRGSSGPSGA